MNWPRRKSRSTSVSSNLRERRRRSPLTFLCSSHAAMSSTVSSLCSERRTTPLSRLLRNSREVRGLCVDESRDGRHERPARPGSDIGDRPLASAAAASAAGTAARRRRRGVRRRRRRAAGRRTRVRVGSGSSPPASGCPRAPPPPTTRGRCRACALLRALAGRRTSPTSCRRSAATRRPSASARSRAARARASSAPAAGTSPSGSNARLRRRQPRQQRRRRRLHRLLRRDLDGQPRLCRVHRVEAEQSARRRRQRRAARERQRARRRTQVLRRARCGSSSCRRRAGHCAGAALVRSGARRPPSLGQFGHCVCGLSDAIPGGLAAGRDCGGGRCRTRPIRGRVVNWP